MKKDSALSALLRNKTSKIVISNTTTIIKNYGLTTVLNTFFDTFLARAFKMTHKHIKRKKKRWKKKEYALIKNCDKFESLPNVSPGLDKHIFNTKNSKNFNKNYNK